MLPHNPLPIFDSHLHIIDDRFPLVANNGYLPPSFDCQAYQQATNDYVLSGGAVVSGSFQAFDQEYLLQALATLGPRFVGVTQLPASVSDNDIEKLHAKGVRALRFNLKRGGSENISELKRFAHRVYDLAGWHVELYVDSAQLGDLRTLLPTLPAVSIDHLGLSQAGLPALTHIVEQGVKVKATGFGRVDFEVAPALKQLYNANPHALMFGTDLPSTRAPRAYQHSDYQLIIETLGETHAQRVLSHNALDFYQPMARL